MLLVETDRPISVIASETGFSNLSNFNRRFLEARGMTPRDFRRFVVKYGRMPDSPPEVELTRRSPSLEARRKRLTSETGVPRGSMPPSVPLSGPPMCNRITN
jgi:AraC-like DNA-binding protein